MKPLQLCGEKPLYIALPYCRTRETALLINVIFFALPSATHKLPSKRFLDCANPQAILHT